MTTSTRHPEIRKAPEGANLYFCFVPMLLKNSLAKPAWLA
jgi:hypothetical protein